MKNTHSVKTVAPRRTAHSIVRAAIIGSAVAALMFGGSIATNAVAAACKKFSAELISAPTDVGCTSQVGLCTAGTIDGNRGISGTTYFVADSIVPGPGSAPNGSEGTISYSGLLMITTPKGTLQTRDTGIFDVTPPGTTPTGGLFSSFDQILGGTGKFNGATGTFLVRGQLVNGQFVSDIQGTICVP